MRAINFEDHVANELARLSFAPQRRWLRLITLGLGFLTVLALLTIPLNGRMWALALALGLLTLVPGAALVYYEQAYRKRHVLRSQLQAGLRGQRHLAKILAGLDDNYYLVNNLRMPGRADDIDHIVVGPNGIFALETKNHRGRIFWQDGQWYQSKMSRRGHPQPDATIRDPVQQLKRNVDHLRSCINHTDPALSRRTRLWIEGAVVFTHPAVSLDLAPEIQEISPFPVLRARDLPAHILGHRPRRPYSKADIRQIVGLLGHLQCPYPEKTGDDNRRDEPEKG